MRKRIFMILLLSWSLFVFAGCSEQPETELHPAVVLEGAEDEADTESLVCVHVCGAVKSPGVYELPVGSRICHAVELAGGFRKKADSAGLNQAELLVDGMQIYVPTKAESKAAEDGQSAKVNLNTASREELMTLTGIGEAKADAILAYRDKHGRFQKIEDIMNISGIKEGMFAKIEDDITV